MTWRERMRLSRATNTSPPNGAPFRAPDDYWERWKFFARLMGRREELLLPQLFDFILKQ
jgi:hypothetical protein